ncbi:1-acyl-sn-glycerol-3-phosphate acyltransferase [Telluribacter sp. SYSU D00476]|uniref:1-acyl-sn-glycerol-3-phosphate acyltransferase n=1 Tax=Telluribacter sp. SYSU D00476 TaxID=2811430 RepID=UPI001FF31494|nr:1-acyl-sn-glycerol-3-phosphate acyltransferase [Telluribacter sp. SYSU D00476]
MLRSLIAFLFRLAGWKVVGSAPVGVPKSIWVVIPHTSNWDFPVGLGTRATLKIWIGYLAKQELFRWYSGWLFRALGGYPVDRSRNNNLVDAVVDTFRKNNYMHIAIAPEGTRTDVARLKTGFYYMALGAGVPLIPVVFSHPTKTVTVGEALYLTGKYQQDMKQLYDFYLATGCEKKTWLRDYERTGIIPEPGRPASDGLLP